MRDLSGRFFRRAVFLTIGVLALMAYPAEAWLGEGSFWSLLTGGILSAVVVSVSFGLLAWSFDKSNRIFMITYVAGFLGRMIILGCSILLMSRIDGLNLVAGSMAILIVYLTLTALEIKTVNSYRSAL